MKLNPIMFMIWTIYSPFVLVATSKPRLTIGPVLSKPSLGQTELEQRGTIDLSKPTIAKYAIAALMGAPASTMKVKKLGPTYLVTYNRANDGEHFSYKIKFNGSKILWGKTDGRWRNATADEKLSYSAKSANVFIHIMYSDGSSETKKF